MSDSEIRIETSPAPAEARRPAGDGGHPDELAILPLRETVLFPQAVIPLAVARPSSVRAVDEAVLGSRLIGLVTQLDAHVGFKASSAEFVEAGIPHVEVR